MCLPCFSIANLIIVVKRDLLVNCTMFAREDSSSGERVKSGGQGRLLAAMNSGGQGRLLAAKNLAINRRQGELEDEPEERGNGNSKSRQLAMAIAS